MRRSLKVKVSVMNLVYLFFFSFLFFSIYNTAFITLIPYNYSYFPYYYINRVTWSSTTLLSHDSWYYHSPLRLACNLGYVFLILSFYDQLLVIPFIYPLIDFSFIYPYVSDLISDHNQYKSYQIASLLFYASLFILHQTLWLTLSYLLLLLYSEICN